MTEPGNEVLLDIQKARLLAFCRQLATLSEGNLDHLMLLGVAVGLKYAALHPEAAAALIANLDPPDFEEPLEWVVRGSPHANPEIPLN